MTKDEISLLIKEEWDGYEFLLADGFEDAFISVVHGKGRKPITCYDRMACVRILADRDGMTHEEIADRLGVAVGTSKSQLHKARARMRDLLAPPMGRNEAGNHA